MCTAALAICQVRVAWFECESRLGPPGKPDLHLPVCSDTTVRPYRAKIIMRGRGRERQRHLRQKCDPRHPGQVVTGASSLADIRTEINLRQTACSHYRG